LPFTEKDAAAFVGANKPHVNRLRKTVANLVTVQHILYFYQRLQERSHDNQALISKDWVMDSEAFMTTIVMSYGRLFSESKGAPVFKKKIIPKHLHSVHDEIITLRNERYAHHGNHETTAAEIELFVFETKVEMKLHLRSSLYYGVVPHWGELFDWFSEFLKESFTKQLKYLSETSGKEWCHFDPKMEIEDIIIETAE